MEEIKLKNSFNAEDFTESTFAYWELLTRKNKKSVTYMLFLTIGMLLAGYLFRDDFPRRVNVFHILGSIFAFYFIIVFSANINSRRRMNEMVAASIRKYEAIKLEVELIFSDDQVIYKDNLRLFEMLWDSMDNYVEYKNFLFIRTANPLGTPLCVMKKQADPLEYKRILDLLEKKGLRRN